MGNHGRNDEGAGRVLSPHLLDYHGEDGMDSWGGGIGVTHPLPVEESQEAA